LGNGCSVRLAGSESICHSAAQHLHTSLDIHDAAATFREFSRDFAKRVAILAARSQLFLEISMICWLAHQLHGRSATQRAGGQMRSNDVCRRRAGFELGRQLGNGSNRHERPLWTNRQRWRRSCLGIRASSEAHDGVRRADHSPNGFTKSRKSVAVGGADQREIEEELS
jgi:hypothetical protein